MFIKLTTVTTSKTVTLNVNHIVSYNSSERGTFLQTVNDDSESHLLIKETTKQIDELIKQAMGGSRK